METNAVTNAAAAGISPSIVGTMLVGQLMLLAMYLLPTIVAGFRKHRQIPAIALLNIVLGWTILGWIGAFIWALTSPATPQVVIVQQQPPTPPA